MKRLILCAIVAAGFLTAMSVQAYDQGDWIVRAGMTNIDPDDPNGTVPGLGLDVEVDDETYVTFNGTWMWKKNWGIELLAALPFEHDIIVEGLGKVGSVKHLPPTLSLQYHFLPDKRFQPYVGAGLNLTLFFDDEEAGALEAAGGTLSIEDDSSVGLAAQIGADFMFNENWFINVDFRYIDIDTEARVFVPDPIVPGGATVDIDVDIDPFLYGLNIGYRF